MVQASIVWSVQVDGSRGPAKQQSPAAIAECHGNVKSELADVGVKQLETVAEALAEP